MAFLDWGAVGRRNYLTVVEVGLISVLRTLISPTSRNGLAEP